MSENATSEDSLYVRRLNVHYRLPADHPDPESLQRRLNDVATTTLPETLGSMSLTLGSDETVVLIRRLKLDLTLNAGWDQGRLANHWARRILRELTGALHTEGGQGIARYPNRAAFVVRFIADLAHGQAWGKWYYREFDGLRMLPVSAAVRTALCDPENGGTEVLLRLAERDLVKVLQVLTPGDGRRVLDRLAKQGAGGTGADAPLRVFLSLLDRHPDLALQADTDIAGALRLAVEAIREEPRVSGLSLTRLALATVRLVRYLVEHPPAQGRTLMDLLASGDRIALYRHCGAETEHWMPLLEAPGAQLEALGGLVTDRCHARSPSAPVSGEATRYTRFGGLFLLLPLLDEFPVSEITKDWPAPEGTSPSALLRLLLILKCLGHPRTASVFFDPLVRDLLAIEPGVTPMLLARWQGALSERHCEAALQRMRDWQRSAGIAGDENLVLADLEDKGDRLALLLDCAGGWLYGGEYSPDRLDSLERRAGVCIPPTAARLVADPALAGAFATDTNGFEVLPLGDERLSGLMRESRELAETLARLDRLGRELAHLSLPSPFRGPRAVDLSLSLMAQGLLRALARRLPGFALATLPHLFDNFLDFGAAVEADEGRYLVRLERPPLHMVLNMTGMARNRYRLSWLGERVIELCQEG